MSIPSSPLANRQVLVTGGTGFTGTRLIRQLTQSGARVRAIARPTSNCNPLKDCAVEWLIGDVFDQEVVERGMRNVTHVFHLATLYRYGGATEAEHRRVHVDSTRLIAEAARQQAGFQRLVHVSTVGVHGHIRQPPANESAPFRPGDEYQRTKAEAEEWLTNFAASHHLPYTIIRPAGIFGPGDTRLLKVFRLARHRVAPIPGRRPCLYHLIHVDDLVDILIRAAVSPAALGEAFIAGNPQPIPLDEMLQVIGQTLGRSPRIIRLPIAPFYAAAALCEAVFPLLNRAPPLYKRRISFFTNDRSFDTRKVREVLDIRYQFTNQSGLTQTARWYQQAGWL